MTTTQSNTINVKRDAIAAWESYQETGLHATSAEVFAWLETWGEENEQPAPVCSG